MKRLVVIALITALAGCRGEPVPRDYQNAPPAMTHPPDNKAQSPAQHGMGEATPETSSGAEGPSSTGQPITPSATGTTATSSTSVQNTPPVSTTTR